MENREPLTLNPAQRRYLKQLSHHLKPLLQLGKEGVSSAFLGQLDEQIGAHELIKIRVLGNCLSEPAEISTGFGSIGVTIVQKVGHIYTVFRQKEEGSQLSLPD